MATDPGAGCHGDAREEAAELLSDPGFGDWVDQKGLDRATRVSGSETARKLVADRLNAVAANWIELEMAIAQVASDVTDRLGRGAQVDLVAVAVEPVIERLGELAIGTTAARHATGSLVDAGHELVVSLLEARPVDRGVRRLLADVAATAEWEGTGADGRAAVRTLLAGVVEAPRAALGGLLQLLLATAPPRPPIDGSWVRDALRVVSPVRATVVLGEGDAADAVACSFETINHDEVEYPDPLTVAERPGSLRPVTFGLGRHVCPGERIALRLCESFLREMAHALRFEVRIAAEQTRHEVTPIHRSVESLVVVLPEAVRGLHGA